MLFSPGNFLQSRSEIVLMAPVPQTPAREFAEYTDLYYNIKVQSYYKKVKCGKI